MNAAKSIVLVGRRAVVRYSENVCIVHRKGVQAPLYVQDVKVESHAV